MYTKTECPHCGKKSYVGIKANWISTRTGDVLEKVTIADTLKEEDLLKIVSKFVHDLFTNGTSTEDIQEILSRCLGISPQFTEELITKIVLECELS